MNTLLSSTAILFRNSKRSLLYGSVAGLTVGLEELVESVVFDCPCEGHFAYGLAFLWIPALLLFLTGILIDRDLWKYARVWTKRQTQKPAHRYLKTILVTPHVFVRAGIAPAAWLVLSFLQQQYYTCAYFGPPIASEDATLFNVTHRCHFKGGIRSKQLEDSYKAHSQIVGWALLLMVVTVLFTSVCIRRCIKKAKQLEIPTLDYYRHVEAKEALVQFHVKAKEIAKESGKRSIDQSFEKVENKNFDVRIQEVANDVVCRYGLFFVIPESPVFKTPEVVVDKPPKFVQCTGSDATDGPQVARNRDGSQRRSVDVDNSEKSSATCDCQHKPRQASLQRQTAVIDTEV